jgi:dihydroorotate dehydrogenase electron transfer subunit
MRLTALRAGGLREVASAHFVLRLSFKDGDAPAFQPGQFVHIQCAPDEPSMLWRPYSVMAEDSARGEISILFNVVGPGSAALARLKPGAKVNAILPLGNSFSTPPASSTPLLVAGGVGAAPLVFLYMSLKKSGKLPNPVFLMGAGTRDALLIPLLAEYGIEPVCATDDGSYGMHGFVTDLLAEKMTGCTSPFVYSCGPLPMLARVKEICGERVPGEMSLEIKMACGIGACMGCNVLVSKDGRESYVPACKDGPVFETASVRLP